MSIKETYGNNLVGLIENSSDEPQLKRVKELFAEIAEIVHKYYSTEPTVKKNNFYAHTTIEILNCYRKVLKFLNNKY